jgi:hypothetical protein
VIVVAAAVEIKQLEGTSAGCEKELYHSATGKFQGVFNLDLSHPAHANKLAHLKVGSAMDVIGAVQAHHNNAFLSAMTLDFSKAASSSPKKFVPTFAASPRMSLPKFSPSTESKGSSSKSFPVVPKKTSSPSKSFHPKMTSSPFGSSNSSKKVSHAKNKVVKKPKREKPKRLSFIDAEAESTEDEAQEEAEEDEEEEVEEEEAPLEQEEEQEQDSEDEVTMSPKLRTSFRKKYAEISKKPHDHQVSIENH